APGGLCVRLHPLAGSQPAVRAGHRGAARPDPCARPRHGHARRRRPHRAREPRDCGLRQPLYGPRGDDAHALLAAVTMLGLYDAEETRFDAVIVDGHAYPLEKLDLGFHADFDPTAAHLDEGLAEARWKYTALAFNAGYRWARRIPVFFEDFGVGDRF